MNKIIKIICLIVFVILLLLFLYLYLNKLWLFNPFNNIDIEPKEVILNLKEEFDFESCYEMDEEEVKEKYYINDISRISSYDVLSSYIGLEAEEIAFFKFNDNSLKESFKENLEKRVEDIIKNYEGYSYSQTETAKDYEVKEYNNILLLVIHKNKDKIIKYIEKIILEK